MTRIPSVDDGVGRAALGRNTSRRTNERTNASTPPAPAECTVPCPRSSQSPGLLSSPRCRLRLLLPIYLGGGSVLTEDEAAASAGGQQTGRRAGVWAGAGGRARRVFHSDSTYTTARWPTLLSSTSARPPLPPSVLPCVRPPIHPSVHPSIYLSACPELARVRAHGRGRSVGRSVGRRSPRLARTTGRPATAEGPTYLLVVGGDSGRDDDDGDGEEEEEEEERKK